MTSPHARLIFEKCQELVAQAVTPEFGRLLLEFDDVHIKNLLVEVDEQAHAKRNLEPAARLRDLIATIRRSDEERRLLAQARALKERQLSSDEALNILDQLIKTERSRQGISAPTDG